MPQEMTPQEMMLQQVMPQEMMLQQVMPQEMMHTWQQQSVLAP